MCDKKSKSTQQSTSTTSLTDWSKNQLTEGKDRIRGIVDNFNSKPYVPFSGPMVADLTQDEVAARDLARTTGPRDAVNYRTFAEFDPETYYNPFEDEVIAAVNRGIDENLTKSINDNQLRATASGAYGGSRHGVADAELMRTAGSDKADKLAQLRHAGFNEAADRFERESGAIYNKDVRNSDTKYGDTMNTISMLAQLGAGEREIEQAKMLAEKAKYDEAAAEEWKRFQVQLNTEIGLFGSTPMLTTNSSSGSSTSKTSDPLGTIASISGGIGGLFTGLGNFAGAGAGAG